MSDLPDISRRKLIALLHHIRAINVSGSYGKDMEVYRAGHCAAANLIMSEINNGSLEGE